MWTQIVSGVWRRLPRRVRRLGVMLFNARFTVTVGAVILDEQRRVLLLEHRFRPGNAWGIPGGFINPFEQPEDAIRRELQEEVGLEVEHLEIAFINSLQQYQQIEIVFRVTPGNAPQVNSVEVIRAEWFDLNALPAGLIPYQRWLIKKATGQI